MANLPEEEKWEDVYQWETSDRALGGPGGVMNKPLRNLTNRTAFLKKQLEENTGQATTNKAGIVKLSNLTDSSSKTEAATPSAVKAVYDLAAGKLSKDGNLSDLTDVAQALANLGLGDAATRNGITAGLSRPIDGASWVSFPISANGQAKTLIIQTGMAPFFSSPSAVVRYPISFPTVCMFASAGWDGQPGTTVNVGSVGVSSMELYRNGTAATNAIHWFAIGY